VPITGSLASYWGDSSTSFEHRYVPSNNWNKEAWLQSVDKTAANVAKEHAQLWINHDQPQSHAQMKLPAYYE
jgi:hypothetical protein